MTRGYGGGRRPVGWGVPRRGGGAEQDAGDTGQVTVWGDTGQDPRETEGSTKGGVTAATDPLSVSLIPPPPHHASGCWGGGTQPTPIPSSGVAGEGTPHPPPPRKDTLSLDVPKATLGGGGHGPPPMRRSQ